MPATLASVECLAVAAHQGTLRGLLPALRQRGAKVDVAADLAGALAAFEHRGGHSVLLLAPDLAPGVARKLLESLRAIDPGLRVLVYGHDTVGDAGVERLPQFHPSSRAGIVTALRALVAGRLSS